VIGLAPAYKRAPLYDRDAIIRSAGKQNEDLARKLMPIRGRHQEEVQGAARADRAQLRCVEKSNG
jgi:hypothetical protein